MNCPTCKASLAEGTRWCPSCGTALSGPVSPESGTAAPAAAAAPTVGGPTSAAPSAARTPPGYLSPQQSAAQLGQPFAGTGQQQTSVLAILSLVAGVLAFVALPLLSAIAAVILGYQARKEIAHSGGTVGGDGLATAGIWLGWINLALSALAVLVVFLCVLGPFLAMLGLGAAGGQ